MKFYAGGGVWSRKLKAAREWLSLIHRKTDKYKI
jgi:hypothetical protein